MLVLVPATAAHAAATLQVDRVCYASTDIVSLSGTGFSPPGGSVRLAGPVSGDTVTNDSGAFSTSILAPIVRTARPKEYTIEAVDQTGARATITISVARATAWTNAPTDGDPTQRVTWRFAGFFTVGAPIYAHLRYHGRTVRDYRFGVPSGPCGELTVTARRLPIRRGLRAGTWQIKLDQSRRYRTAEPGRMLNVRVRAA